MRLFDEGSPFMFTTCPNWIKNRLNRSIWWKKMASCKIILTHLEITTFSHIWIQIKLLWSDVMMKFIQWNKWNDCLWVSWILATLHLYWIKAASLRLRPSRHLLCDTFNANQLNNKIINNWIKKVKFYCPLLLYSLSAHQTPVEEEAKLFTRFAIIGPSAESYQFRHPPDGSTAQSSAPQKALSFTLHACILGTHLICSIQWKKLLERNKWSVLMIVVENK